ncbi:adenosylmethionine decarboxylase [bacterium]|nr:adenosylmethionine decarboxylase [bacterium]
MSVRVTENGPDGKAAAAGTTDGHSFTGHHLLLAYEECAADLNDKAFLESAMRRGIEASGAHIRGEASTRYEPQGMSLVFLLSESHASLHTYPEFRSAFLDIFTCGTSCRTDRFDEVCRGLLKPAKVHSQFIHR